MTTKTKKILKRKPGETDEQYVKRKYKDAKVSLNQYAYIDGFADIPYEIVVCGKTEGDWYEGPIRLAVDCRSHEGAWADAAYKISQGQDFSYGPAVYVGDRKKK